MKTLLFFSFIMGVLGALVLYINLNSFDSAKFATQYATITFINDAVHPRIRAQRIAEIAQKSRVVFDMYKLPLQEVDTLIKRKLDGAADLDLVDTFLMKALVQRIREELQAAGLSMEDRTVDGSTVLMWISQGAQSAYEYHVVLSEMTAER